jgi:hypothetical protein
LADRAHRVAGEADALVLQLVGGLDRDELRAGLAGEIHEHREQEPDAVRPRELGERGLGEMVDSGGARLAARRGGGVDRHRASLRGFVR